MAFLSKSAASMLFISALCFLFVVQFQSSDCNVGSGCFYVKAALQEMQNRKLLDGVKGTEMQVFKNNGVPSGSASGEGLELREAPMGPDPLHHHGGSPIKPRTP
ncbi:hypothetical protein ACH5RR_009646 [Cinchona calisaya]|uniref:CLAVATA3/ESR-related protein n=1 Tax=Cinchona calisaya TaxID=153742 RepID=A0ABD3AEZ1_9GENT